ncbi:MAG: cobalamin B12-binding domain-containing protein [Promethearchaeota archaeon]
MENYKILDAMKESIVDLNLDKAIKSCKEALSQGIAPNKIIEDVISKALKLVGEKYEAKEYFIPELIMAGEISSQLMKILLPRLNVSKSSKTIGKVIIGTGKGDIHDIGKNIVITFLKAEGFKVIDLGVDVTSEQFIEAIKKEKPDILAISALISSTLVEIQKVLKDLKAANLKDKIKVIIGGPPVTKEFSESIGADGFAKTAIDGVKICKRWILK